MRDQYPRWRMRMYRRLALWSLGPVMRYVGGMR